MNHLRLAIAFLTVIPVRLKTAPAPGDLGRAASWFPLVGAVIGGLAAAAYYGLSLVLPPLLAAALSVAVWIALTGGLHLDGLADCCDGMLNASSPERRLEIMKDPRLGAFGGTGLVLAILIKISAVSSLPIGEGTPLPWLALPLAGATARWLLLPAGIQKQARPGGMGADFASGLTPPVFFWAGLGLAVFTALAGWPGLAAVLAAHLLAWLVFRFAHARLGGLTGDVFGLLVELAEITVLIIFCTPLIG